MSDQPVFGLIASLVAPIESGAPFGPLTSYYRALIEYATTKGWQSFVFSPRDVLRQRRTIWGWSRHQGTWVRSFMTAPNIAYTRLPLMTANEKAILLWLRDEAGVQFINQPELDEMTQDHWRLVQILQSHPTLGSALPDTILLRDTQSLSAVLHDYPQVVVRPRFAGQGARSGSLTFRGDEYFFRHEVRGTGHTRSFRSAIKLRSTLEELYGEVVVQQYLPPFRIEGCPVTIRSLWQQSQTGQWAESAVVLRVGQPASQTYQAVTVGLLDRYQGSLRELLGTQLKAIQYQVKNIGRTVVDLLSLRSRGAGELSLELVITESRGLKLLDVSTLQGLDALRRLPDPRVAQQVLHTTVQYAQSLYKQTKSSVLTAAPIETP